MYKTGIIVFLIVWISSLGPGMGQSKLDSLVSVFVSKESEDQKLEVLQKINLFIDSTIPKDSVTDAWDRIIKACEKSGYEAGIYFCKYNKAKELRQMGDFFGSLNLLNEVLEFYKKTDDKRKVAQVHNSLGIFYKYIEDYEQAKANYLKSVEIQSTLKDSIALALYYLNLGSLEENHRNFDEALNYLQKSESILKKYNNRNLVSCYINFGDVYTDMGKTDSAYSNFQRAYKLAIANEPMEEKFHSSFHFGMFLFQNNKKAEAEAYLLEAEDLYTNYVIQNFSIDDQIKFNDIIRLYYDSKSDFEKAYHYSVRRQELEDQNNRDQFNYERFRIINEFNVEKERSRRKNLFLAFLFVLLILLISILLIVLLYRNYQHKQKANRLLTEMDELKSRLFSDISHELRTPLTLILAPLEQMLSKEAEKKPSRSQIKLMRKNANAILNLVNQMLDLSKIDAKSLKLEITETDITSFIRAHFASFASFAQHKNISFSSYTPADRKIRSFDADKLEKIINNLVSNAIKYTPDGGQVFCFANFPEENILELIIQDTGKGIPKDEIPYIFNRFHQVKGSNTGQNIGTGIGLALTRELVELMHGKISFESIVGEGTKFKVSLPLGTHHLRPDEFDLLSTRLVEQNENFTDIEEDESTICAESVVSSKADQEEVLIVDDQPEISAFIRENLSRCYRITTADNGLVGWEKAIEQIPDLIISDVMMPEMDGFELSKKLKADERTSHIPIILLTAKSSQKDKLVGLETGVEAFLPKPFNMKELEVRVKKLIEQRRKLRERFTRNLMLEPKDIAVNSADGKFLERVMEVIETNMSDSDFEVGKLQEELYLSRTQLFRKIKALTDQTPGEFIRTIRLKRAAQLMEQRFGNIAQITFEVGFNNPSYFAKCFKEIFGVLPSEYLKKE